MRRKHFESEARGVALVNLQKQYSVHSAPLLAFARSLKRQLRLGKREFNICLVDDDAIRRLNAAYRGKDKATDVLSFSWNETTGPQQPRADPRRQECGGLTNFLGDVVISVETARRSAGGEEHSTLNEIRWLILHGVLHLLGYDHERDSGEMIALELAVREQLGVAGGWPGKRKVKRQSAKGKRQKAKGKAATG
jgi:probable rRNA maturation factor